MTDEEFEKEIDKMYEEIDQKQAEMEELGLINYGDSGYYWRNPEEYEKDSTICELESEIERLEYLLEISDKALELACELIKNISIVAKLYGGEEPKGKVKDVDYFKNVAKEKMKSE